MESSDISKTEKKKDIYRTSVDMICYKLLTTIKCVRSDQEYDRFWPWLLSRQVIPCLLVLELTTFYMFFYKLDKVYTLNCFVNLVVCVFFDCMIVWCQFEARRDPGYTQNYIQILSSGQPSVTSNEDPEENASLTKKPQDLNEACKKCDSLKTPQVHHCKLCGKCVFLMDHHCVWTNQCVGYGTMKPFVLFNFYTAGLTTFGIPTILYNIVQAGHVEISVHGFLQFYEALSSVGFAVPGGHQMVFDFWMCQLSAGLGVFALGMALGFIHSVMKNQSMVDKIKAMDDKSYQIEMSAKPTRTIRQSMSFIFGQESLDWRILVPIQVRPPLTEKIVIQANKQKYWQNGKVDSQQQVQRYNEVKVQACDQMLVSLDN